MKLDAFEKIDECSAKCKNCGLVITDIWDKLCILECTCGNKGGFGNIPEYPCVKCGRESQLESKDANGMCRFCYYGA